MECDKAIKRNEGLIYTTIWLNLEDIMLSEGSLPPRTVYGHMISFLGNVQNSKSMS